MKQAYRCQVVKERERDGRPPGPLERVLQIVKTSEPLTAASIARALGLRFGDVTANIERLESRAIVKRWTDNTSTGDGRTFAGTVNQHGLAEPVPSAIEADVDPRTVLSLVRGAGMVSLKQLARRWPMPVDRLYAVANDLAAQGHIEVTRRNRVIRLWANHPGWNWV